MTETETQERVVNYLKMAYPKVFFTSSPAGLKLTVGQVQKMMRMGYMKGTADLFIMEPRGKSHGLWLELKTEKGGQSPGQPEFGEECMKRGYTYLVARGYSEAVQIIKNYIGGGL